MDAIFILQQIIEFEKPVFLCFIDLKQAFDCVGLNNVVILLREKNINKNIIEILKEMDTKVLLDGALTEQIQVSTKIR